MTRFPDDQCHADPCANRRLVADKPAPLGRTALAAVVVYVLAAVLGWALVGLLIALVLL
jgi:hypothetical protein